MITSLLGAAVRVGDGELGLGEGCRVGAASATAAALPWEEEDDTRW
jgi:hypothetical protein